MCIPVLLFLIAIESQPFRLEKFWYSYYSDEDNNKTWFLAFVQPVLKNRLYDFALIYREHVVGVFVLAKTKSYNLKFSLSFFQLFYCRL